MHQREPLDSIELIGSSCHEPSYHFSFSNTLNNAIKKSQTGRIGFYMAIPKIEPIDTNNIEKEYTAFIDNTYEDLNIIYAEGNHSLSERKFKALDFTTTQNVVVEKISKKDFDKGHPIDYQDVILTIEYPQLKEIQQKYDQFVQEIFARSKVRSKYFHALYIVDSKRKKMTPKYNLTFFEEREKDILDIIIPKNIRELSFIDVLSQFDRVGISVYVPGTKINVTLQQLKNKKTKELLHFQQLN